MTVLHHQNVEFHNKIHKGCVSVIYRVHGLLEPTVYSKKYAHGFCFAVLCCGYTLTDFPVSIRLDNLTIATAPAKQP